MTTDRLPSASGMARMATLLLLCALVPSCASMVPAPPEPSPPVQPAHDLPPSVDDRLGDERFCTALAGTIESWTGGFTALRRQAVGEERWSADPLDGELDDCVVDGAGGPAASYACMPAMPRTGGPGAAVAMFTRVQGRIDRCLDQAFWHSRRWLKSPPLTLFAGERQVLWRDQAAWPRPALQLKLEQDDRRPGGWRVHLLVYTLR